MNSAISTMKAPMQDSKPVAGLQRFPPGRWRDARRCDMSAFTAIYADHERDFVVAGERYSEEFHYFDLSLSGRPAGAQGCFPDLFSDYQRLGNLFFVPAGCRYRGQSGPGRQKSVYVFLRAHHLFAGEEFGANLAAVLRDCTNLRSRTLREILERIGRELQMPGIASDLLLEGLGTTLLAETIRLLHNLPRSTQRKGGLSHWRMKVIKERIGCGDRLPTLNELAHLCGLSRRHLARAFRQETGQTIGAFVQQTALERAKILLCTTTQPIGVIAAKLGFTNAAVFSTAFRRSTGESPRNFRTARIAEVPHT